MIPHVAWPKDFFIFNYNEIDTFFFFFNQEADRGRGTRQVLSASSQGVKTLWDGESRDSFERWRNTG